jgi:recombinational DNA repair ATPase RecF
MIRINTIHIEEFRGIRAIELDLEGDNFGICGPNGSGKSGVVDAVEFCITGDVTRLSGHGSSGITVKAQAPHVDQREHPENANVTITATVPSLGKTVTIHRSVKNPKKVEITPDDADVERVIEELQTHPEFALSRREIIKYIITPPGKRSEDVQTLLRLEYLEELRKILTTFRNQRKDEADKAEQSRIHAEKDLITYLGIDGPEPDLILEKVNEKRALLNLDGLTELSEDTSFKAGVPAPMKESVKPKLRKSEAMADLSAFLSTIRKGEPTGLAEARSSAKTFIERFRDDEKILKLAQQHGFIKTGLDFVTEDACPLCDKEWNAEALREHLRKKLSNVAQTEELLEQLRENINTILQSLSDRIDTVERTIKYGQNLDPTIEQTELKGYITELKRIETELITFLKDYKDIELALQAISASWWLPKRDQQARIDDCHAAVVALPDASVEDMARESLIVAQERYEKLVSATKEVDAREVRSTTAQKVLEHYNASCTEVLEDIYNRVAEDFSKYYRLINPDDEKRFAGKLESTPPKLSFDVDFYGRGLFPPGAYHSEGHQDAMGLCLYLALMKHTLGENFTFAVLDDVLMSVDTGHRREVCRILKSEFPNTQFILTTHDRVWLQYMKTEGLIKHSQLFSGWTIDTGPRIWDDHDIWNEIQDNLDRGDVPQAAWLLRRYLEYTADTLADKLRARVKFRGDGNYGLSDLLPPALNEFQKKLKEGIRAASHWQQDEQEEALSEKHAKVKEVIARTNAEQWAINPTVHFNEWANLQPHEFQEVVDAFKELLENLRCLKCASYLYVSPRMGNAEELRCNCGDTIINLKAGA